METNRKKRYIRGEGNRSMGIHRIRPWIIPIGLSPEFRKNNLSPLFLVYGFAGVIGLGTFLLWLPISNDGNTFTPVLDALFTAASAVCVTGLIVVDTGTYWSTFGQGVILGLIQIGGFGFMTSATLLLLALGRRINLRERMLIAESMGLGTLGGLVKLVRRIAVFTFVFEFLGAALFYIRFSDGNSIGAAAWRSIFHSISAFNNAGFDIFGNFQSLTHYHDDVLVVLVTAALVIIGGISFLVFSDIISFRRFSHYTLDSKMVLVVSAILLITGTGVILLTEYSRSATMGNLPVHEKLLDAFFQSVTSRTAGFSTIDMSQAADYTLFFTILLMFVGGAVGSTAGGIKVNTFGIILHTIWSSIKGREHPEAFGRELIPQQIHRGLAVAMLSMGFITLIALVLTISEDFTFLKLLFETVSAFGTVGLSTGITPGLSEAGKSVIIFTMFVGRLGPLALILALIAHQQKRSYRYPQANIRIG